MKEIGIYIHIPFCIKKCKYCDFISFENKFDCVDKYINSLISTIENCNEEVMVDTIYFGGGTPSSIDSKYIIKILDELKRKFNIKNDAEITIEINPGTINEEKLIDYKNAGINRISIGLQSTNNNILKTIGRIHTYEQFLDAYKLVKKQGFNNINVDLMLALPTQTMEDLKESLNNVIKLNPNHISLYSLILEEGTILKKEILEGKLKLLDEESEREMYHITKNILEKNGYNHYEISNFAKNGFESKHNLNCWNQKEYLGFGVASHSYFNNKRFSNVENLNEYLKNIENKEYEKNIIIHEEQNRETKAKEFMMIGLRKIEGISISDFEQKFGINPLFYFRFEISILEEEELIEVDLDNIRLTSKGLDLANIVFEKFI